MSTLKQKKLTRLLTDTIRVLCQSSLDDCPQFTIQGLLGITMNTQEIFLVHINEFIENLGLRSDTTDHKSKFNETQNILDQERQQNEDFVDITGLSESRTLRSSCVRANSINLQVSNAVLKSDAVKDDLSETKTRKGRKSEAKSCLTSSSNAQSFEFSGHRSDLCFNPGVAQKVTKVLSPSVSGKRRGRPRKKGSGMGKYIAGFGYRNAGNYKPESAKGNSEGRSALKSGISDRKKKVQTKSEKKTASKRKMKTLKGSLHKKLRSDNLDDVAVSSMHLAADIHPESQMSPDSRCKRSESAHDCTVCRKHYSTPTLLANHYTNDHFSVISNDLSAIQVPSVVLSKTSGLVKCADPTCSRTFPKRVGMWRHLRVIHGISLTNEEPISKRKHANKHLPSEASFSSSEEVERKDSLQFYSLVNSPTKAVEGDVIGEIVASTDTFEADDPVELHRFYISNDGGQTGFNHLEQGSSSLILSSDAFIKLEVHDNL